MFKNLVESGSHARDLKRRGGFMAASVIFYAVALCVAGVGSIYAYNVRLEEREELEVLSLMAFVPPAAPAAEPEKRQAPVASGETRAREYVQRPEMSVITPYNENRQVAAASTREVNPHVPVRLGPDDGGDYVASPGLPGPNAPGIPSSVKPGTAVVIDDGETEEPPAKAQPKPEPPRQDPPQIVSVPSSVLVGKVVSKPVPVYPVIARQTRVQGAVPVQILVDETGSVVSAQATGGHPLLQTAAVQAARRARFTPTILTGRPVKVSGIIIYNFVLN